MNEETVFIIAYYMCHPTLIKTINAFLNSEDKTIHMKLHFDLKEDTELTLVQCDLYYAALSNVEWDVVCEKLEKMK